MNFNILKYKQICDLPASYLTYDKMPAYFNAVPGSDYDYYYDGFGDNDTDAKDALMHAVSAMNTLISNPNNESAKATLITDIRNFLKCNTADNFRKTAYYLIIAAAGNGLLKEISEVIDDYFQYAEDCIIDGELLYTDQILDFRKLYIRLGDKALFEFGDIDTAMTFYSQAGAWWNVQEELINYHNHDENEKLSGLSEEKVDIWHHNAKQMRKLLRGQYNIETEAFEYNIDANNLRNLFEAFVVKARQYSPDCLQAADEIIQITGTNIKTANDRTRIGTLIIESIRRNYGVQILHLLNTDKKTKSSDYQDEILDIIRCSQGKRYSALREWLNKSTENDAYKAEVVLLNVSAVYDSDQILSLLRRKNGTDSISGFYTNYNTFSLMLPDKCVGDRKDECGMLSVMNIAYMNDPNEGVMIRKCLYGDKIPHRESERTEIAAPYIFIKCFTSMIDYLPMWQMYGDAAKGVCLVMDWENAQDLALYKVCYLNKTQKGYSVRVGENQSIDTYKVEKHLRNLRHTGRRLKKLDEKLIFDAMIAPILYLFKDISYSYEQEYRIMYQFEKSDERIRHTKPKEQLKGTESKTSAPMLYVLPEHPIQIKELILGPKFEDITNTMPYLHEQMEKMAEKTGTKEPVITISNINFR